jgi:hypothetical protein
VVTDKNEDLHVIGASSQNARAPAPKSLPTTSLKNFLVAIPKSMIPSGAVVGAVPLDLTNDTIKTVINDEYLSSFQVGEELYLARCPCAFPVPLGSGEMYKGEIIDQTIEGQLEELGGSWGTNWLLCVRHFNQDIQSAFLEQPAL